MEIIHLDMDAFYASVEALDNPELRGLPIIVGGSSDRGVVSAASYEARRFGVHSAMPIVTARRLCPEGIFLPVRMDRYRAVSRRIHAIFHRFTPLVEPISLDEAFLDVTGCGSLFGTPPDIAGRIKELIRDETGLTASAGVASSKLVAKIASDCDKPDGLTVVPPGAEREFLAGLAINRLWGVGRATRESLELLGVRTIGDLARLPVSLLTAKFGKHGCHLHAAARGIDQRPVEPEREIKSIGHEETFESDLLHLEGIRMELLALADKVGRRLRRYGLEGRTLVLKVKYHDFVMITRSHTLAAATDDTAEIFAIACNLLPKTEAGSRPIRLLGITLANLCGSEGGGQLSLFPHSPGRHKRKELYTALDHITDRFGQQSIRPATLLPDPDEPG